MAKPPRPTYAISAAEEISAGYTETEVIAILRKRFGALSEEQVDTIMGQARAMVLNGMSVERQLRFAATGTSSAPSEPVPGSGEIAIQVKITPEGEEPRFRELRIPFPEEKTWDEILKEIEDAIQEWITNSGNEDDDIDWSVKYVIIT